MKTLAYAAMSPSTPLTPYRLVRREVGVRDVKIEILFCGVCHSDLHQVRDEWGRANFPIVPGHEIVGKVVAVGAEVRRHRVGDTVAVGTMVDSCRACDACGEGLESYCDTKTMTYNSPTPDGGYTQGGYSQDIVVDEDFVLRVPEGLDLAATAPLLCAGATTWSPLRHWGVGPGDRVGVVGLGGLGHMAVKFAHQFGAHVTLFTRSPGKEADARRLGVDEVVLTRDPENVKNFGKRLDYIIDTVSAPHDVSAYLETLKFHGKMILVGLPSEPMAIAASTLVFQRRTLAGSMIAGIKETQEMLDYCAEHGITSDIELIRMDEIDAAYDRMMKSDVRYRFVIDMATLKE